MKDLVAMVILDINFLIAKFARFLVRNGRIDFAENRLVSLKLMRLVSNCIGGMSLVNIKNIRKREEILLHISKTVKVLDEYLLRNPRRGL